ncbi:MAG: element excision factor XisH family protein, partial [Bacteroidota bacterium]
SKSVFYELHEAIGQYKNYKRILRLTNQERPLYLAMPLDAYEELFQDEFGKLTIEEEELKIIVYQPSNKTIVKWIN